MKRFISIVVALLFVGIIGITSAQAYEGIGRLKDSVTKLNVPGATITVVTGNPTRCSPVTDDDGSFVCEYAVSHDSCTLRFEKPNYKTKTDINLGGGTISFTYINPNTKIEPFGWFVGTVKTSGGVPIQGALVYFSDEYQDTTKEDGSYQIFLPAGGPYGLTASSANCLIEQSKVGLAITAGQGNVQNFSLPGCK